MAQKDITQYLDCGSELGIGDYIYSPSKRINILLIGRSQTGKTTIVQNLLYPQTGTSGSGFSDTREPACNSLILLDKTNGTSYQLNILDTPGLKEVCEKEEKRSDQELLKLASKCVEEHIISLNVVCFVSSIGKTHLLDVEVFENVKKYLGDKYSAISMMVLTHCDEYSDAACEGFEHDIRTHETSKPYFEYCKLGIVRYGAVDIKKLQSYGSEDLQRAVVKDRLERIEKMRNSFAKKIICCAQSELKISELQDIYEASVKSREELIKEIKQEGKCIIQ